MGGQEILREDKGSEEARACSTGCVKIWISSHGLESISRDENWVRRLAAWHNSRVSTTPVVVPLQGLVMCACGTDRWRAAMDIVLQLITLMGGIRCWVNQAKVHLDGH